jgi:hypothetical protein
VGVGDEPFEGVLATDGRYANYEAFIGVPWEGSGCSGHNICYRVAAERAGRCPPYRRKRTFGNTIGDKKPFGPFACCVSSDPKWQACELDASHSPNVTAPQALVEVIGQILPW